MALATRPPGALAPARQGRQPLIVARTITRPGRTAGSTRAAAVAIAPASDAAPSTSNRGREQAKNALLELIRFTNRGLGVRTFQRGQIEEAQVAVEAFQDFEQLEYKLLAGKWRLVFTTASDVLPILEAEYRLGTGPFSGLFGLPRPLEVGNIYQRFTSPEEGVVENIIEVSTPLTALTFTVGARYEVRSGKRIALTFEEARLGNVRISETTEALLAPALLPRGSLQHQLLLALRELQFKVQFRTAAQLASQVVTARGSVAASYLLTFLDDSMLIGRAIGLGGTFIFVRE